MTDRESLQQGAVSGLQSLRVVLGIDSPETRGWAPLVQQEARRAIDCALAVLAAGPHSAAAALPVAQAFGIIDPDYARVFTQARILAWQYGYACLAHGSFTRDLDLLLVPWTDAAQSDDVDYFAPRIADAAGLRVSANPPSIMPHGRKTWTLLFPGFADPRWVDLSVLAPAPLATPPAAPEPLSQRVAELEAALRWIEGETAATPGLTDVELGRALALIGQRAHAALEGPRP